MNSTTTASSFYAQHNDTDILKRETTAVEYTATAACIFAIIVNGFIFVTLLIGPRSFRVPTYFFVANLALANLLSCVTVLVAIFINVGDEVWERILLKGSAIVCFSSSVSSLLIVAIDRFVRIQNEEKYQKIFTKQSAAIFIFLTWTLALILFLLCPLLGWSCYEPLCWCPKNKICVCDPQFCSQSFAPFSKSFLIVGVAYFYVSFFGMFLLTALIFSYARNGARKQRISCCCSSADQLQTYGPFIMVHRRREFRLAKSLTILMVLFFICWLPLTTLFIMDIVKKNQSFSTQFDYCLFSSVLYSLINPIVITSRFPRIRKSIRFFFVTAWRRLFCIKTKDTSDTKPPKKSNQEFPSRKMKRRCSNVVVKASVRVNTSSFTFVQPPEDIVNEEVSFDEVKEMSRQNSSLKIECTCFKSKTKTSDSIRVGKNKNLKKDNKKRKRSVSDSEMKSFVTLHNGTHINRDEIEISSPFNPEFKMAWD